jgi:hypothetical protein
MTASLAEAIEIQETPPPAPTVLPLKELKKGAREWNLTLYPAHLALADAPDTQPYVIVREEVMKSAVLTDTPRAFMVTKPIKANFSLTAEAAAALESWIGKSTLARYCLGQRYGVVLPAAILWIFGSMPVPGNPDSGFKPIAFDPWGMTLGFLLVASWAWAKLRPQAALFLVDSLWFLGMGAHLLATVLNGRSKWWLVLVPVCVWMVFTGVKNFMRFRGTPIPKPAR